MKNKKDSKKEIINEKNEIKNLVLLVLCVTIIFFMFYGLTLLIMKKDTQVKNVNITLSPLSKFITSLLDRNVFSGIYNGYVIFSILDVSSTFSSVCMFSSI